MSDVVRSLLGGMRKNSAATNEQASVPEWFWALIFAVFTGAGREAAIATAIGSGASRVQASEAIERLLANQAIRSAENSVMRLRSRDWLTSALAALGRLEEGDRPFETRSSVERDEFIEQFYSRNRALYLPGTAAGWPAVTRWQPEYLAAACGDDIVEVMMNRTTAPAPEQNTSDALRRQLAFRDFIKMVFDGGASNDYYMVSRNRFFEQAHTRSLLEDLGELPFVNTRAAGGGVKMWFGPAGTITPLHHDDRNNVIVQVVGKKRVRLYPAVLAPVLRQKTFWFAGVDPGLVADHGCASDEIRVDLQPGDALFIPVGWWHAIDADTTSITLAMVDFGLPNDYGRP